MALGSGKQELIYLFTGIPTAKKKKKNTPIDIAYEYAIFPQSLAQVPPKKKPVGINPVEMHLALTGLIRTSFY